MSEIDLKVMDLPKERFGDSLADHYFPTVVKTVEIATPAKMALDIACRWGIAAADADGEDTAGRQKLRSLTPDEIADKACRTAQALWSRFERLGWLVSIPEPFLRVTEKESQDVSRYSK